jgi:hypothetical protein
MYCSLQWADIILLVPREELNSVESVLDIATEQATLGMNGWLFAREQHWLTYSLDRNLQPQAELPEERRMCALFTQAEFGFALTCTAVIPLDRPLAAEPLPACLRKPYSPLTGLSRWGEQIALVTDSARLAHYLQRAATP